VRDGDGYVINGEKSGMTAAHGRWSGCPLRQDRSGPRGARGVSAFLLPLDSARRDPASLRPTWDRAGSCADRCSSNNVRLPADSLIGPGGGAFSRVMQAFDYTRALIGIMCLGAAQAAIDETAAIREGAYGLRAALVEEPGRFIPDCRVVRRESKWRAGSVYRTLWLRDQEPAP